MAEEIVPTEPVGFWDDPGRIAGVTRLALYGLLAALVWCALWWGAHRPMFTITTLVVEAPEHGELRHVTGFEMRANVLPQLRGNFFTIDIEKTRRAFEDLPWVHAASVRRRWPNCLVITLTEHTPIGTWGDKGEILSAQGISFMGNMAEAEQYGRLAAFAGPPGTEQTISERYTDLKRWLAPAKLQPVAVTLSERLSWTVELDNGIHLALGRDDTANTVRGRIDRFLSVYPQLRSRLGDTIEAVDLRYPHGMAIRAPHAKLATKTTNPRLQ